VRCRLRAFVCICSPTSRYLLHLIWSQDPDGLTLADREARLLPEPTAAALEGWYLAPIHRAPCAALSEGALARATDWG